jgi:hypothetical protein
MPTRIVLLVGRCRITRQRFLPHCVHVVSQHRVEVIPLRVLKGGEKSPRDMNSMLVSYICYRNDQSVTGMRLLATWLNLGVGECWLSNSLRLLQHKRSYPAITATINKII